MALFLIRHASAGVRHPGSPDDLRRELDAAGHDRARTIADYLTPHRPTHVLSSPAVRCRQTVEPLASAVGAPVEDHEALAEGTPVLEALTLLTRLASEGVVAALCSHGDLIPELIRTLERTGTRIEGRRQWQKGSVWTLEVVDGEITTARYEAFSGADLFG